MQGNGPNPSVPLYFARKCTTDKLQVELNDFNPERFSSPAEVVKIEYVGGRDWVIVFKAWGTRDESLALANGLLK